MNRERAPGDHAARIPTQLLSAAHAASLVPVAGATLTCGAPGVATILGSLLYSFGRFGIECLRDEPRFGGWGMTRGQIASALGGSTCLALLLTFPAGGPAVGDAQRPDDPSRMTAWLAVVAASLLVFLVCSLHWKRVGRW